MAGGPQHARLALWLTIATAGCTAVDADLTNRPCAAGDCVEGYACHPERELCVPELAAGCGAEDDYCPDLIATGDPCPEAGAFLPCDLDYADCDGGCRTCGDDLEWSACTPRLCLLGDVHSCGDCDEDCTSEVAGAEATCVLEADGFACSYVGDCYAGAHDIDDDLTNGCECQETHGGSEACDGLDNDCDGGIDEENPCASGELCVAGVCELCGDDNAERCGGDCLACAGETPLCSGGLCRCADASCPAELYCDGSACVACGLDDPLHCGASCDLCAGETPGCRSGGCVCEGASCGVDGVCFPEGDCRPYSLNSTLSLSPSRVDADGVETIAVTVTLYSDGTGLPLAGRLVLLSSDRPEDLLTQPPMTDAGGRTIGYVASPLAGLAEISAVNLTDRLGIAATVSAAFAPLGDSRYPLDAPSGIPLAVGDLGGVADADLSALWHFDDPTGTNSTLDEAGTNDLFFGELADFETGFAETAFTGRAYVVAEGKTDLLEPYLASDASGTSSVTPSGGGIELFTESDGTGPVTGYNLAQIEDYNSIDYLAGDFDVRVDYAVPAAPGPVINYNVTLRYQVVLDGSAFVRAEYFSNVSGNWMRGVINNGTTGTAGSASSVSSPADASTLRLVRRGATQEVFYLDGASWHLLHSIDDGSEQPATSVRLGAYAKGDEAVSMEVVVDNYHDVRAPRRSDHGTSGRALSFDGIDDRLDSAAGDLTFASQITLELWFKSPGVPAGNTRLLELSVAGNADSNALIMAGTGTPYGWLECAATGERFVALSSGASAADDRWHHLALTYGFGDATLYLDGANVASSTGHTCADLADGPTIAVGGYALSDNLAFTGDLDAIAIFDVLLTPQQIADHYQRGAALDRRGDRPGTLVGATSVAGILGEALAFDGDGDHLVLSEGATPIATDVGFTLAGWVRLTAPPATGERMILARQLGTAPVSGFEATVDDQGQVRFELFAAGVGAAVTAELDVADDAWHHLALVNTTGGLCIYVDAAPICATHALVDTGTAAPLVLGGDPALPGDDLVGRLDDWKLFARPLSSVEISADAVLPFPPASLD